MGSKEEKEEEHVKHDELVEWRKRFDH